MAETTRIAWADATFNPWVGCQKVSAGCDNCYAEVLDHRLGGGHWGSKAARKRTSAANWNSPLRWNRKAAAAGRRMRVFCASLADVFDNAVDPSWRSELWDLIRATPWLDWMLLTKRPQNIAAMLPPDWGLGWSNVWLGTTVENQAEADRRIRILSAIPARIRFLSCEPLLSYVETPFLRMHQDEVGTWREGGSIHWVIVGGESGREARWMHPLWARSLRDRCADAGVPFFFKQWGEWLPRSQFDPGVGLPASGHFVDESGAVCAATRSSERMFRVGKREAGHLLDGVEHRAWPRPAAGLWPARGASEPQTSILQPVG